MFNSKIQNSFIAFLLLSSVSSTGLLAATQQIKIKELNEAVAAALPGDTLIVANGTYTDVELRLKGMGTEAKPIVVMAEEKGKVIISGKSNLRLAGEYVEFNGFYFKDGYSPEGPVWEYRMGNDLANHCRITQCAISYFNPPSRSTGYFWVLLHGRNNRFDRNSMEGKLNIEMVMVVDLGDKRSQDNHHRIEYNYFGYRPIFGSNGGETIRIGNSYTQFFPSRTLLSNNVFEHCNGEVEAVSIKSRENTIKRNLFWECSGVLALRHGNRNTVEENAFVGNGLPFTGGIRVVNEGHIIRRNLFYKLAGDRFFSALGLMNTVPNSLPNRYHHVKEITIEENRFVDCPNILFGVGKDNERTQAPSEIRISRNSFFSNLQTLPFQAIERTDGFRFEENRINYPVSVKLKGFVNDKSVNGEIDLSLYPNRQEVGASWYHIIGKQKQKQRGVIVKVTPKENALYHAIGEANSGDTLEIEGGVVYWSDRSIEIDKTITIRTNKESQTRAIFRYNGKRSVPFILLKDGANLDINDVYFNGTTESGKGSANYGITTDTKMITPYGLTVNNCEFSHFESGKTGAIRGGKGTFSESVQIDRCYFHDMVGDAIRFADEKEEKGVYSVENIEVKRSQFIRMLGVAVEVYRGGNDESTSGPTVTIEQCSFSDVNNRERGSVLNLQGVQQATINNLIFDNSGRGGASIRFNETRWDKITVSHINLWNSGRISSFWEKVIKGNITKKKITVTAPTSGVIQ